MNPKNRLDLVGRRFGRLRVTALDRYEKGYSNWTCICDCGTTKVIRGVSLTFGAIRSCGCLHREQAAQNMRLAHIVNTKTGLSRDPTYAVWTNMLRRCRNPRDENYRLYGGRGITVCDRWSDFANFVTDMGLRPPKMTIERNDPNGHYEPGNVRWASPTEQANNQRRTKRYVYNGRTDTLANWARHVGLSPKVLRGRLGRGWSFKKALTTSSDIRRRPWDFVKGRVRR